MSVAGLMAAELRRDAAADEDAVPAVTMTMAEYAAAIPEPGVGPLRFEDFPFQREWYSEEVANAEEVVLAKSAQVGASAYAWRWAVRQADQFGDRVIVVHPSDLLAQEFGDERVEPAIEESPYLQRRIPTRFVKTKRLKRIGAGFVHMRGSNSAPGAQSIAAGALVFDEYDHLDQANLVQFERRISGARQRGEQPRVRRLGYPTTPNTGIDAVWRSSDQRVWHVVCKACGDEQPVGWEDNFRWRMPDDEEEHRPGHDAFEDRRVLGEVWRCCRTCEASLEDSAPGARDGALRGGRWIAQRPGAPVVGFHAWRGMVPVTDLRQLVIASRATSEREREAFSVLDLGRPHTTGEAHLDEAAILRACSFGIEGVEMYAGPNPTTMGVDVASERDLNVWIDEQLPPEADGVLNPRRALYIGRVSDFQQVAELIARFNVHICCIDGQPERRMAKTLRATYPGRVVLVEYDTNPLGEPLDLRLDDAGVPLRVRVNRTDAIDGMMDAIRQVRSRPLLTPPAGFVAQMKALHRVTELDTKGRPIRRYVTTGTDGDDYAHAAVYALVAAELWRAQAGAQRQLEAMAGSPVPDEEFGFQRARLAMDYGTTPTWE